MCVLFISNMTEVYIISQYEITVKSIEEKWGSDIMDNGQLVYLKNQPVHRNNHKPGKTDRIKKRYFEPCNPIQIYSKLTND